MSRVDLNRVSSSLKKIAKDERLKSLFLGNEIMYTYLLKAAKRYIGGETVEDCFETAKVYNQSGIKVSIDYCGESITDQSQAISACLEFIRLADLMENNVEGSISLDLSHIGLCIDRDFAKNNLFRLLDRAKSCGLDVMISMEGADRTDDILELYTSANEIYDNAGITIQAYLERSLNDLKNIIDHCKNGKIRIVKGAYDEANSIPRGEALTERFILLCEQVIASQNKLSIATHDSEIIERLKEILRSTDPISAHTEFEMLRGVSDQMLSSLTDSGYDTRIYLIYGMQWHLYFWHRLAEHPQNVYQAIVDIGKQGL